MNQYNPFEEDDFNHEPTQTEEFKPKNNDLNPNESPLNEKIKESSEDLQHKIHQRIEEDDLEETFDFHETNHEQLIENHYKDDIPHNTPNHHLEKNLNVELVQDPIKAISKEKFEAQTLQEERLCIPNLDINEIEKLADYYPKIDGSDSTIDKTWLTGYVQGINHVLKGGTFSKSVERDTSLWKQKVSIDGHELGAGKPRFGGSGNVISGEKALMKATHVLGLGSIVQIPLWHTGIWLSIKAPQDAALFELERTIANEKITLGRYTSGMVFSNTSVYTVSHVINFIFNHVYDGTLKSINSDNLKKTIKITDLHTLVWGMACAIYPNGYPYSRACTVNPSNCQHVVHGDLNLTKLSWTDNNALTDVQRRHMTKRNEKFSKEDLKKYQDEHSRGATQKVELTENLSVYLDVPTLFQYEQSGFNWVDNIVKLLDGSLAVSLKGEQRDNYIIDQGRLTALRQYAHWVSKIEIGEDYVEDHETIEQLLGTISSDENISNKFFDAIGNYIDNSMLSVIAIPKYACPACSGLQEADIYKNINPYLLPLDVIRVFFTLRDQRIYKALIRKQL